MKPRATKQHSPKRAGKNKRAILLRFEPIQKQPTGPLAVSIEEKLANQIRQLLPPLEVIEF